MRISRTSQLPCTLRRSLTSSLYATKRNPQIVPTDASFQKFSSDCHDATRKALNDWLLSARDRYEHAPDETTQAIFAHMQQQLASLQGVMQRETFGMQGRELYLATNSSTSAIEAIVYARERNGAHNICPSLICVNPNNIPSSLENINRSAQEGYDSFLLRKIISSGVERRYAYISFNVPPIWHRGCHNIVAQRPDAHDQEIIDRYGSLCMPLALINKKIHRAAGLSFPATRLQAMFDHQTPNQTGC